MVEAIPVSPPKIEVGEMSRSSKIIVIIYFSKLVNRYPKMINEWDKNIEYYSSSCPKSDMDPIRHSTQ